ncbi:MAG: hypothetical protein SFV55_26960 [Haliscomenobacter sp.]|uniref:hypothetical protein n=1 Tax=Haliscomenobacter sp. TaxID=2717303 RepID=UPI0029B99DDA|nr:hypothetical protein [Haliscomenobacter sp.]MDX2072104.1 hypothetical protein [Haliscomenobacter sp.]
MVSTILRAKHWQLFVVIFGIPFLVYLYIVFQMVSVFSEIDAGAPDPMVIFEPLKYFMGFSLISMIVYWVWYWSVGVGLQHKLPDELKLSTKLFKVFLFLPAFYITAVSIFVLSMVSQLSLLVPEQEPHINPIIIAVILPIHFFSIFCIFYCIYFVAKSIKTAELQRKVKFSDFVGEFFLVWFFPIGVWILQPTINKLEGGMDHDEFDNIL